MFSQEFLSWVDTAPPSIIPTLRKVAGNWIAVFSEGQYTETDTTLGAPAGHNAQTGHLTLHQPYGQDDKPISAAPQTPQIGAGTPSTRAPATRTQRGRPTGSKNRSAENVSSDQYISALQGLGGSGTVQQICDALGLDSRMRGPWKRMLQNQVGKGYLIQTGEVFTLPHGQVSGATAAVRAA
jgi:hypothetical protein